MDKLTLTPAALAVTVDYDRREGLKRRIAAWNESAAYSAAQAKGCREAGALRSAEYWERDVTRSQEYAKMAQHELEQLGG